MSKTVIEVKDFCKSFGEKKVIKGIDFEVGKGEIFGFIGANGSGKTTTIRTLLNIYSPDKGNLLINGQRFDESMTSLLGYLPEERGLYLNMRVLDTLVYFARLKGISVEESKKRAIEFLNRVGLEEKQLLPIKKLSSGQQQKIQLGITLMHKPKILILDEPTKGLDPVNRKLLLDILFELNQDGATIMFSTHLMEEAEKIADRLLMIKNGKAALYGGIDEIKNKYADKTYIVVAKEKIPANKKLFDMVEKETGTQLSLNNGAKPNDILKFLIAKNIQIIKFEKQLPSLEEIFIKVTKDE